jgi:hypothetical protein
MDVKAPSIPQGGNWHTHKKTLSGCAFEKNKVARLNSSETQKGVLK